MFQIQGSVLMIGDGNDDDDAFTLAFVYTLDGFTAKPIIDHTIN